MSLEKELATIEAELKVEHSYRQKFPMRCTKCCVAPATVQANEDMGYCQTCADLLRISPKEKDEKILSCLRELASI